ncbi:MAG: hypothetical protein MUC94_18435, partial [bacterium]|nr:hypothetical protein [bacterium]
EGTLFSLSEELEIDPSVFYRVRAFYDFNPRHHLGILIAPLSLSSKGQLDRNLVFQGKTFSANTPLDATYRFNSYRLVYRYDFLLKEKIELGGGDQCSRRWHGSEKDQCRIRADHSFPNAVEFL